MNTVPCPGRIIVDLGEGFTTGCVLGSMWYFSKGILLFIYNLLNITIFNVTLITYLY